MTRDAVAAFEAELREQRPYFTEVTFEWEDPIAVIRTQPGYLFDDGFWDIFHRHELHVCHVAYYGPERREDATHEQLMAETGVYELRFVTRAQAIRAGRALAGRSEKLEQAALARERGGGTPLSRSEYIELHRSSGELLERSCDPDA